MLKQPLLPTWCPGCGNYFIFSAIKIALTQLKLPMEKIIFTYDVGCCGNMADFLLVNGFHGLHGRALPLAAGIKFGYPEAKVFSIIGDGGCFGEGVGHFISLCRGNHDLVVLAHDNFFYSLTTGQKSPTTPKGTITPSTPQGVIEEPFNPVANALINSATFVARAFSADISHLAKIIVDAANHTGFSFIDILQPCPTFNKFRPIDWYKKNIYYLDKTNHNPQDFNSALEKSLQTDKLAVGVFYQTQKTAFHQHFKADYSNSKINLTSILQDYS